MKDISVRQCKQICEWQHASALPCCVRQNTKRYRSRCMSTLTMLREGMSKSDFKVNTVRSSSVKDKTDNSCQSEEVQEMHQESAECDAVQISVWDSNKNKREVFYCSKGILLREIPYFRHHAPLDQPHAEIEISVQCDLDIFRKLLRYVKRNESGDAFHIEPLYAVHLLTSADFLQMDELVDKCAKFCHDNMNEIIKIHSPVGGLSEPLLTRIALLFDHHELEAIEDSKDRVKSKLYKGRVCYFLKGECHTTEWKLDKVPPLIRCTFCNKVLVTKLRATTACLPYRTEVSRSGDIIHCHKRDPHWDYGQLINALHKDLGSWHKVYWKIWGLLNTLTCIVCNVPFSCSNFSKCRYHPEAVQLILPPDHQGSSIYPCCGQRTWKYNLADPVGTVSGCAYKNHVVAPSEKQSSIFQDLLANKDLICGNGRLDKFLLKVSNATDQKSVEAAANASGDKSLANESQQKTSPVVQVNTRWPKGGLFRNPTRGIRATLQRQMLNKSLQGGTASKGSKVWNPSNTVWHNQDAVRAFDHSHMDALLSIVRRSRISYPKAAAQASKRA